MSPDHDPLARDVEVAAVCPEMTRRVLDRDLRYILPKVLSEPGIERLDDCELLDQDQISRRHAETSVERVISLMIPSHVALIRMQYVNAAGRILGSSSLAVELGITTQYASGKLHRARAEFQSYAPRVISGTFDYGQWSDNSRCGLARRNALPYMANVGMMISPLSSLADLKAHAADHLKDVPILSAKEKMAIAAYYHLDDNNIQSIVELGELVDCYPLVATKLVKRAMGRVATRPTVRMYEKNSSDYGLEPLPDSSPGDALQMVRRAVRDKKIALGGGRRSDEMTPTYFKQLDSQLKLDGSFAVTIKTLGEDYEDAVHKAYKLIFRYSKRSGSLLVGTVERDTAIIKNYLEDAMSLKQEGLSDYLSLAGYIGQAELQKLYDDNPDIVRYYIRWIVQTNRYDVPKGILDYRKNVEDALVRYKDSPMITPGIVAEYCVRYANYHTLLERYSMAAQDAMLQYELHSLVSQWVIKHFALSNPMNTVAEVELWLGRRAALLERYPLDNEITVGIINKIALRKPLSVRNKDGQSDEYIQYCSELLEGYKHDLHTVRKKFRHNPDIDDAVIRRAGKKYIGNAEKGVRKYCNVLKALRELFGEDDIVDDTVVKYYASEWMSNTLVAAGAVRSWKTEYKILLAKYSDAPQVDDTMVRYVAMRWRRHADFGFSVAMRIRDRQTDYLQSRASELSSGDALRLGDMLTYHGLMRGSATETVEADAMREEQQSTILQHLAKLKDEEQQAVLAAYGLEDAYGEPIDVEKISSILNTNDLYEYVENVIMPKLRSAAQPGEVGT